jgi:hypothetical protein
MIDRVMSQNYNISTTTFYRYMRLYSLAILLILKWIDIVAPHRDCGADIALEGLC